MSFLKDGGHKWVNIFLDPERSKNRYNVVLRLVLLAVIRFSKPSSFVNLQSIGFLMKLFRTTDMEVIKFCHSAFNFVPPRLQVFHRRRSSVNFRGGAQNFCPKNIY